MKTYFVFALYALSLNGLCAQHAAVSTATFSPSPSDDTASNIFLVHRSKPNQKTKTILESFLTFDHQGREMIHSVLFAGGESVYITIADEAKFSGKDIPFVAAVADTASFALHIRKKTLALYIDSLSMSLSAQTTYHSAHGMSTIILLNGKYFRNGTKGKQHLSAVTLVNDSTNLFTVKINKDLLRGGPRFRRAEDESK